MGEAGLQLLENECLDGLPGGAGTPCKVCQLLQEVSQQIKITTIVLSVFKLVLGVLHQLV